MAESDPMVLAKEPAADDDTDVEKSDAIEAMSTFISAVKAGDAESAHAAWEAYKVFCDAESADEEADEETFTG
jgi:hypothetical protein